MGEAQACVVYWENNLQRTRVVAAKKTQKKGRDICILGYAEETRDLVFNLDESVEVWGINMAHAFTYTTDSAGSLVSRTRAKPTAWFQMHPRNWANPKGEVTGYFGRPPEHMNFLKKFDGDLWLQKEDPDLPNGKRFPLEEIAKAAGRTYFTSTFAYQLGMAWYQHTSGDTINSITVYGVNLSGMDEYIHQKSCVEYWLGRVEQAGIKINIPVGSALLKGKLYAIGAGGDISDHAFERLQFYKGKYMEAWANTNTMLTMKSDTKFWAAKLSEIAMQYPEQFTDEVKQTIQEALNKRVSAIEELVTKAGAELNGALGVVKENQHWLTLTGGIDHRAPQLPELRIPSPMLESDFEPPQQKSI